MSTSTGPIPYAGGDADVLPGLGEVAWLRVRSLSPLVWPLLALAALLLFNFLSTPGFFKIGVKDNGAYFGSLIDVLKNGSPTLLLALGMTLVIGTGGIDLSVGAIMALAGAMAACLVSPPADSPFVGWENVGTHLPIVLAAGLFIAVLAGIWNGVLVAFLRLQPIVATLILMVAGRGAAQLLTNGQIPTFEMPGFVWIGSGAILGLPVPFVIAATMTVVMLLLVRGTAIGLFVEAVGNNRVASRIAGVNATGVRLSCYAISGFLAGIAGLIATADNKSADVNNLGLNLELDAILAAAIGGASLAGGRFSLLGSVLGAFVIQLLTTTILARGYPQENTFVIKAIVIVALCLVQSSKFLGLFKFLKRSA